MKFNEMTYTRPDIGALLAASDVCNNSEHSNNAPDWIYNGTCCAGDGLHNRIYPIKSICRRLSCFYTAAMLGIFCDNVMDCTVYRKIHAPNVFLGDYNIVVDSLHRCFFAVAGRRSK